MSDDFDFETEAGVPEALPVGERIMWQGKPIWTALARRGFHADMIAGYFGLVIVLRLMFNVRDGQDLGQALIAASILLAAAALAIGVVLLIAWQSAHTTVYTLTTKRIVMRFGIALPVTLNIPLSQLAAAGLAQRADGSGDIALAPTTDTRLAYLMLWPHVRAWHINHPEPTLRCIADADQVAELVGEALRHSALDETTSVVRVRPIGVPGERPSFQPASQLTAAE